MKKTLIDVFCLSAIFLFFLFIVSLFTPNITSMSAMANKEEKIAYLTFDDGPSKNTEEVLKILDKYDAKATFFVTATSNQYLDKIKTIYDKGHQIGVHTYSHDYQKIYSSRDAFFEDINQMNQIIKKYTGKESKILRFPGGSSNTVSKKYCRHIMSDLTSQVEQQGFHYFDWNASNGDGNSRLSENELIQTIKKEVYGQDKIMVLMHDGAGNNATIKALPTIMKHMKDLGYTFKVIDNQSDGFHHHVAN